MKNLFTKTVTNIQANISKHWVKIIALSCFAYMLVYKDLRIHVNMNSSAQNSSIARSPNTLKGVFNDLFEYTTNVNMWHSSKPTRQNNQAILVEQTSPTDYNLANTYSNMSFWEKEIKGTKHSSKKQKQKNYVQRFKQLAQAEMKKYSIPASIILAQGLIETNAGESRLSTKNNNHFGMKCFSKKCKKGHCSNFTDDSHKDFFRIYNNAWESYRSHSLMLQGKRYRHLTNLTITDYKNWAKGLKKAGYATDPKYAFKLIHLIESLKLYKYDT